MGWTLSPTSAGSASLPPGGDTGLDSAGPEEAPESHESHARGTELLQRWGTEMGEFGMSGRCHSLTALFHFGYTAWKQMLATMRAEGVWCVGDSSFGESHIAEEEGGFRDEHLEDDCWQQAEYQSEAQSDFAGLPVLEERAEAPPSEETRAKSDLRELVRLLDSASRAADCGRPEQAVELCGEGIALARASLWLPSSPGLGARCSGSAPSSAASSSADIGYGAVDSDSSQVWQLLLLRSSTQAQLRRFDLALGDAEELISLQPTCAEGYWWQSVALHGLHRPQEALEALMSALEYEPQNPMYQQAFTSLFEDISSVPDGDAGFSSRQKSQGSCSPPGDSPRSASPPDGHAGRPPLARGLGRNRSGGATSSGNANAVRLRAGLARDALSTTTQATHLSSRSTTPTEVSERLSHSSSNDSLFMGEAGAAFEDAS